MCEMRSYLYEGMENPMVSNISNDNIEGSVESFLHLKDWAGMLQLQGSQVGACFRDWQLL